MNALTLEIDAVYNQHRTEAKNTGNEKLIERIDKALEILMTREYYTEERAAYIPTTESCGCKDWQYRLAPKRAYTGPCKHMIAELIIQEALELRTACDITALLKVPV